MICEINNGFIKIFCDNGYYYPKLIPSPTFYFNRIDNGSRENYILKGLFGIGSNNGMFSLVFSPHYICDESSLIVINK